MKLRIGDHVRASPVGPGYITGCSDAGYPAVNDVTVGRLVTIKEDKVIVFDPNDTFKTQPWTLHILPRDVFQSPTRTLLVAPEKDFIQAHTANEAIEFCKAIGAMPSHIRIEKAEKFDLGPFFVWLQNFVHETKCTNFSFEVYSCDGLVVSNMLFVLTTIRESLQQ